MNPSFTKVPSALKHLQPIVHAVAHIQQSVLRQIGAVHRVAELLGGRSVGIVWAEVGVVRLAAVRAPVPLHRAGAGVEHCHARVEIAVRDVGLVGLRIDRDLRHAAEARLVVAVAAERRLGSGSRARNLAGVRLADLQQELSILRELQDVGVARAVSADPHAAGVIDEDAMVRVRPVVALPLASPVPHDDCLRHRTRGRVAPRRSIRRSSDQGLSPGAPASHHSG